ncbi:MAG: DEAD/DEAH box helicase family protein [Actinobacteria bacterium]|nr:DEAD/DEAH box helicase family protein [Actinomycetota bacterium]
MALHKNFPKSPYEILNPEIRWFPAEEQLRLKGYEKLLPPLVAALRIKVKEWRDSDYKDASVTSYALLDWWFKNKHKVNVKDGNNSDFNYYFAQREAVETVIYLYEIAKVKDKYDLIRYDSSGIVSAGMFDEDWRRFVIKMATGSGKTKVLSLILTWSYFHKLYEEESDLARNFLIITPNIIVLDRIRADFEGLKIFYNDPILPENGFFGKDWHNDFQLAVHIQDNVNVTKDTGNIFLTNIHRVYESNRKEASFEDDNTIEYFLGGRSVSQTTESKIDLALIVRDINELVILNDEAHHIHDLRMAWFKSIQDIHNKLLQKGAKLSLQIDVTATPKNDNGSIFVQTISDYPLVEAIYQDIVKHPVLPDAASRAKLIEKQSSKYTEKYEDFIHLGFVEWKKAYDEHGKLGKKAVLFIMTDDTKNCDEVSAYLENRYPELKDSVLTIHTKNNGEIDEAATGKSKEELDILRKAANEIDKSDNEFKAVVSVLVLKEGWDVRNVTTIVGLRPLNSKNRILPEQALGRGLRRMYRYDDVTELTSVVGTEGFMDFVESIKSEGVELEIRKMGEGTAPKTPIVIEIDTQNLKKDIKELDVNLPVLSPRIVREYKNLSLLDVSSFKNKKLSVINFSEDEKREIIFKDITTEEITHKTILNGIISPNFQSVIGYFTKVIMNELRLISGYDILYGKVKEFIKHYLFEVSVDLEDLNILRNLSELVATKTIIEIFKNEINELTVTDRGEAEICDYIKISNCRPFVVKEQEFIVPKKSVFNRIVGGSHYELFFANFLDNCEDIISYVKNFFAVHFKIDYQDYSGFIRDYYPDFIVKKSAKEIFIIETKGQEDLDVPLKIRRLNTWCSDINMLQEQVKFDWLLVEENNFNKYKPRNFKELISCFNKYKDYFIVTNCPKCNSVNIVVNEYKIQDNLEFLNSEKSSLGNKIAAEKPKNWYCRNCKYEW